MREKGKGLSIDSCLTTGWIPTLAKLAQLTRSVELNRFAVAALL